MHGDKFVQAKKGIHFDRIKRPKYAVFFERSSIKCNLGLGEKYIS